MAEAITWADIEKRIPDGIRELLDGPFPPGIAALDPEHRDDLTQAVRDLIVAQSNDFAAAGDAFIDQLPRLLRGAVNKVIGR
jgi:hypothetical protein